MAKSYESLMGAVGRSVFFRPERQRVRELLSRDARPLLLVDGNEYPLFDLSMNGVSFLSPNGLNCWNVGDDLDLALVLHGDEVYKGVARIARAERGPRGSRIGVGLCTGFLDLPDILRRDDENRLERDLREGPASLSERVPKSYRRVMSDVSITCSFIETPWETTRVDTSLDWGVERVAMSWLFGPMMQFVIHGGLFK